MTSAFDFMLAARQGEHQALQNLAMTSELVSAVSRLIHALQIERGFSNLHLGDFSPKFSKELKQFSQSSEDAALVLRGCFDRMNLDSGCHADRVRLLNRVALAVYLLDDLPRLRHKVHDRLLTASVSMQSFTYLINALLAVVFEAADTAVDPQITSALVALFNFMQTKELAGQERATGVVGFVEGYFEPQLLNKMHFLQEGQRRCLDVFAEFAAPECLDEWSKREQSDITVQIAQLRRMAERTKPNERVGSEMAEIWFDVASKRMDVMKTMEDELSERLVKLCAEKIKLAQSDLEDNGALLKRLALFDEPSEYPTARLFNVQAVELGSSPADTPGSQLSRSILDLLHAQTLRLQAMNDEIESARHALSERKTIERAKGELMDKQKLSEEDAYRLMQQRAMERGAKLIDVARFVLESAQTNSQSPTQSD